ncbi:MAG TPA: EI24 domain-containing protein, partial [Stellaceae bacterium]|nr:EI24 domain-containing protein [Stellaceae bacterium]
RDTLSSGIWLLVCTVFGNLVLLPIYFFLPGVNLVLFLLLNGYVLGRGYFDAVTLRRMDGRTARLVWRANRATFIVNGALAAFLLTVPGLNLVAPIVGLAATVHLLERRPGAA